MSQFIHLLAIVSLRRKRLGDDERFLSLQTECSDSHTKDNLDSFCFSTYNALLMVSGKNRAQNRDHQNRAVQNRAWPQNRADLNNRADQNRAVHKTEPIQSRADLNLADQQRTFFIKCKGRLDQFWG